MRKRTFENLTGKRFGRWVVTSQANSYISPKGEIRIRWNCLCDCGRIRDVDAVSLRKGVSKSCGCLKNEIIHNIHTVDLTGKVFGRLCVIKQEGRQTHKGGSTHLLWVCQCSCGKKVSILGHCLVRGTTKSCGCYRQYVNSLSDPQQYQINRLLDRYKRDARNRNYQWELSNEIALALFKKNCFYCGGKPQSIVKKLRSGGKDFIYNGIDRKDCTQGYKEDNCVSCCSMCNLMKGRLSTNEFILQCGIIARKNHWKKK